MSESCCPKFEVELENWTNATDLLFLSGIYELRKNETTLGRYFHQNYSIFQERKSCLGMFPVYYNYNKTIYFAHANLEYKKFQLKGGYFWHLLTYGSTSPTVSFLPSIWLYPQWSFGNPQIHNPGVLTQHLGTEKIF